MIMPQTPRLQLALLAALATVACQATPPSPTPHFQLDQLGGSLVVRVAPDGAPYRVQYLPVADWDWVEGVLTHTKPGVPEVRLRADAAIDPGTGRRAASLTFAGLRAGGGYRLTVTLYRANGDAEPVVVSTETLDAPQILAGVNTLTLTRLFKQTAPVGEAPASLLKGMVTSLPRVGAGARLDTPTDVVVDAQGTVYVADTGYTGSIRRLAADAQGRWWMTMLAGTGSYGNTNGELHKANFNGPAGMALAAPGLLYVVDGPSKALRRVSFDASGTGSVATVSVKMAAGETGAGGNASAVFGALTGVAVGPGGSLFVSDANRIFKLAPVSGGGFTVSLYAGGTTAGYEDGSGTQAKFNGLRDMVVDADGVLYVSDASNHRIRRVAPIGAVGSASTLPMPAGVSFTQPAGLAFDGEGRLLVGDARRLYRFDFTLPGSPVIEVLAGGGSAGFADGVGTQARFSELTGLALAPDGGVWVVDKGNHRVRHVSASEGQWRVVTRAGDGTAGNMNGPAGAAAPLVRPTGVAIAPDGTIVLADAQAHRLLAIDPAGTAVRVLAGTGAAGGQDGPGAAATFNAPANVALAADGSLIVSETLGNRLRRVRLGADGSAEVSTIVGGLSNPGGVLGGPDGVIYFTESGKVKIFPWDDPKDGSHRVRKVVLSEIGQATVTTIAGAQRAGELSDGPIDGPGASAKFYRPSSLALGPDGTLYVADAENHRIRRITFDAAGQAMVDTLAGTGVKGKGGTTFATAQFDRPTALAFDPQGRLVVTDFYNHRLQVLSLGDGAVSTLAGAPGEGYSDGPVSQARFKQPVALAFDAAGHLIVAENNAYGVRKVTP
jgi:sugar lactone lactonase YvrE